MIYHLMDTFHRNDEKVSGLLIEYSYGKASMVFLAHFREAVRELSP